MSDVKRWDSPVGWMHDDTTGDYVSLADYQSLASRLDSCAEFLKEGETPAECIARNRADTTRVLGMLAKDRKALEECTAKLAKVMATPNVSLSTYEAVEAERISLASRLEAIKLAAETGEGSNQLTHTKAALRRILEILSRGVERRDNNG